MGIEFEVFDGDEVVDRFEVRDLRAQTRFAIDNAFYDEYTPMFGPTLSMVYVALVRHANKEQKTWPSQTRIAKQLGLGRNWVGVQLQVLEVFNLIRKIRVGKMCTNRYYLIDERHWRRDHQQLILELWATAQGNGYRLPKQLLDVMHTECASHPKKGDASWVCITDAHWNGHDCKPECTSAGTGVGIQ